MTDLNVADPDRYQDRNSVSGSVRGDAGDEEPWALVPQSPIAHKQSSQRSEVPAYGIGSRNVELRRSDSASQYLDIESQYTVRAPLAFRSVQFESNETQDMTPPYNDDAIPPPEIVPWALVKFCAWCP